MNWKPTNPLQADYLGSRLRHRLRKLRNRAGRYNLLRPYSSKAPRTYAREATAEAEGMIAEARAAMLSTGRGTA